jgi:hypothetical protein
VFYTTSIEYTALKVVLRYTIILKRFKCNRELVHAQKFQHHFEEVRSRPILGHNSVVYYKWENQISNYYLPRTSGGPRTAAGILIRTLFTHAQKW